ncbi:DUF262 domain-containing protein [Neomoorella thermoacetica]|uniref:DUF262 domain-containing protein n=1 Tax=Neomoorella thermoacetica TaxID=1525 RepID=UPI0008FADEB7|nr:DUF262 domain-containing protein [Moorella thermoacetica]APC07762.1 hypothetical protein MTJW_05920 [Moorella thermoacetica]OIQ53533.1 hypothetical protein MORE_18850 [Moorella thermoacetica]
MLSSAVSLWELFKGRAFVIPDYQRAYAWTKRQVEDLWKDLKDNVAGSRKHFMGTIILKDLEKSDTTVPYKSYEIVDGQQRLTSLVMLVAAACRKLWATQEFGGLAHRWYENLVCGFLGDALDNTLRKLNLGGEDDAYFWQAIASPSPASLSPQTAGQRRLSSVNRFFEEKLQNIPDGELVRFLHEGLGLPADQADATERVLFLVYEVANDLDVGLIFETVNDRGKPLSQLDKIKNYLMYLASKANSAHLIKSVNNAWGRVLRNLAVVNEEKEDTEAEENALARYHWILRTGQPRVYEVHHAVKEAFPLGNPGIVINDAAAYIDGLVEASELYLKIRLPDAKPGSLSSLLSPQAMADIRTYLELLNDDALGTMASFAPLLMASLKVCANSEPDLFVEIARLCYLLAWRGHRVCNRRSDAGIDALAKLACDLTNRTTSGHEAIDSLRELVNRYGSDRDFRENLERNTLSIPERRWFLWRWEVRVAEEQKLAPHILKWADARELEVEHIWPQKPEGFDTWPEEWREKHKEIVDQLGNLVLMQKPWNASMSNRLPYYKREDYRNSSQASVRQLENDVGFKELCKHREPGPRRTRWALEAAEEFIRERTKQLVDFAFEEWKL